LLAVGVQAEYVSCAPRVQTALTASDYGTQTLFKSHGMFATTVTLDFLFVISNFIFIIVVEQEAWMNKNQAQDSFNKDAI
jgi:hypothetical protein